MVTTNAPDSSSNFPPKNLTSPWAKVVRGADSSSSSSEPLNNHPPHSVSSSSSLDSANLVAAITAAVVVVDNNNSNADKINNVVNANPKKPAWKNTSNGLVVAEVSPVMGAVSWPALSAKPSAKLTSDSISAVDGAGSISISQGPVISNSPQKQATATAANARHTPPMNHSHSVSNRQQKPMERGGGNNNEPGPLSNNLSNPPQVNHQPSVAPPFPVLQITPNTFLVDGVQSYKNNNGWGPRSPAGGYGLPVDEHSHRGNYGHRPRNNYGTRRNQDPGNTMNTRDAHPPQHRMHSEGFLRPTLPNSAYLGSQPMPMRPFLNPAGFHEFYYYPTLQFEPFGGMPFLTHPPPPAMFFPVAEETPPTTPPTNIILKQIDYYFSDVNLTNDEFLKSNMDEHGWVPVSLIANFPRVKNLTNNIELILDSLRNSSVVEVNGDKLRKRKEWARFLSPVYQQVGSSSISSVWINLQEHNC
ncbi:putative lupus La protein [Medicago truncatula]|uniref:LA-related protein 6 LA RNA-binding domain protein n=1 Tax=Medicago truncatula TaxID=3880 RepID=G7J5U3_MEDTR|nr:la-related protein 1C [Medicago truncatula]AES74061.1 LA-related protein 6 LA RNA-binding domain protein [Medicago truncatula]RHN71163.1 putative lupus La protein [Medicago truncatula]